MNFKVTDMDKLYVEINDIYDFMRQCELEVKPIYERVITSMMKHWIGMDASRNIKDLTDNYNSFNSVLDTSLYNVHKISVSVVRMLAINKCNDCLANNIIPIKEVNQELFKVDDNPSEEYVDLNLLRGDYNDLVNAFDIFKDYYKKIINCMSDFESNWTYGSEREKMMSELDEIKMQYFNMAVNWKGIIENLGICISNISTIV